MTIPMKTEVNCTTGEVTEIPFTAEEISQREVELAEFIAREDARKAEEARIAAIKESAKAKLVAGTPLTEEEAATIVL